MIKVICTNNEETFEKEVNELQAEGWTMESSACGFCNSEQYNFVNSYQAIMQSPSVAVALSPYKEYLSKQSEEISFEEIFNQYEAWSLNTFDTTAEEACEGLKREAKELQEALQEFKFEQVFEIGQSIKQSQVLHEFADCFFYCLYCLAKAGLDKYKLKQAMLEKLEINRSRKWNKNPDNTFSHIKTEQGEN